MTSQEYWNSEGIRFLLAENNAIPTIEERVKAAFEEGSVLPSHIFELIDFSGDEYYPPMGLYHTFEEALKDASGGKEPPVEDCCDPITLKIRKTPMGFLGTYSNGKVVAIISWNPVYPDDESDDEDGRWSVSVEFLPPQSR